jgi:hypothetical protein
MNGMDEAAVAKCLSLASQLFPGLGFPNVTEAAEWAKEIGRYREPDVQDAILRHWKDPERKQNRPHLGAVLALLRGKEGAQKPNEETTADMLARKWGCGKFEAALRHYRWEWEVSSKQLDELEAAAATANHAAGLEAVAAKRVRVRENLCLRCSGCLVSAGATCESADRYSLAICLSPDQFEAAVKSMNEGGIDLARLQRPHSKFVQSRVFREPSVPQTPSDAIQRLREAEARSLV